MRQAADQRIDFSQIMAACQDRCRLVVAIYIFSMLVPHHGALYILCLPGSVILAGMFGYFPLSLRPLGDLLAIGERALPAAERAWSGFHGTSHPCFGGARDFVLGVAID